MRSKVRSEPRSFVVSRVADKQSLLAAITAAAAYYLLVPLLMPTASIMQGDFWLECNQRSGLKRDPLHSEASLTSRCFQSGLAATVACYLLMLLFTTTAGTVKYSFHSHNHHYISVGLALLWFYGRLPNSSQAYGHAGFLLMASALSCWLPAQSMALHTEPRMHAQHVYGWAHPTIYNFQGWSQLSMTQSHCDKFTGDGPALLALSQQL